jgi:hypothetical protein
MQRHVTEGRFMVLQLPFSEEKTNVWICYINTRFHLKMACDFVGGHHCHVNENPSLSVYINERGVSAVYTWKKIDLCGTISHSDDPVLAKVLWQEELTFYGTYNNNIECLQLAVCSGNKQYF